MIVITNNSSLPRSPNLPDKHKEHNYKCSVLLMTYGKQTTDQIDWVCSHSALKIYSPMLRAVRFYKPQIKSIGYVHIRRSKYIQSSALLHLSMASPVFRWGSYLEAHAAH